MTKTERDRAREICREARTMIENLCRPKNDPKTREWVMSIPVRQNDPDMVLGRPIEKLEKALDELDAKDKRIEELEGKLEKARSALEYYKGRSIYCDEGKFTMQIDRVRSVSCFEGETIDIGDVATKALADIGGEG